MLTITDDTPIYNSKIINVFVEYLKETLLFNEATIKEILDFAGMKINEVRDNACWFSQKQCDAFYEKVQEKTNIQHVARHAGRYMAKSSKLRLIKTATLGTFPVKKVYLSIGKHMKNFSKGTNVMVRAVRRKKVEIIITPKKGVNDKPYQCDNRLGIFEAIAAVFLDRFAKIEHPECCHSNNGSCCRYIVSLDKERSQYWLMINKIMVAGTLITTLFILLLWPGFHYFLSIFLLASLTTLTSFMLYYKFYSEDLNNLLSKQGIQAESFLEDVQVNFNFTDFYLAYSKAMANILSEEDVIKTILATMKHYLYFDCAVMFFKDHATNKLKNKNDYGLIFKMDNYSIIDKNNNNPILNSYKNKELIVIEDVSQKSKLYKIENFTKNNIGSFVCSPIIFKDKTIGILFVGKYKERKFFDQVEINLISGVSVQIGISLNNARAYEELKKSEQQKTEFVGVASHKLQSPIIMIKNPIYGIINGFHGEVPDKIKKHLNRITYGIDRMEKIIKNFLHLYRLEVDKLYVNAQEVSLLDILKNSISQTSGLVSEKNHTIEIDYSSITGLTLCGDSELLEQVLINLIQNAVKYTPQNGKIWFTISIKDEWVSVAINDNGIGVPSGQLIKIFEKFYQAENVKAYDVSGAGLGLAISKAILRRHNGKIECISPLSPDQEVRKGSSFIVTLPQKVG